jgi:hypothetical protein
MGKSSSSLGIGLVFCITVTKHLTALLKGGIVSFAHRSRIQSMFTYLHRLGQNIMAAGGGGDAVLHFLMNKKQREEDKNLRPGITF